MKNKKAFFISFTLFIILASLSYYYFTQMKTIKFSTYDSNSNRVFISSKNPKIISEWLNLLYTDENIVSLAKIEQPPDEYVSITSKGIIWADTSIWHYPDYVLIYYNKKDIDNNYLYIKVSIEIFNKLPRP